MATVRLTESLSNEIIENAKKLFAKRSAEAGAYPPEYNDGDFIFDCYLDANPKARTALQHMQELGWVDMSTDIRAALFGERRRLTFRKPRPVYTGWSGYHSNDVCVIREAGIPVLEELRDKLVQRKAAVQAISDERDAFVQQVTRILNSSTTLKKALSLWPGLWELVPNDARMKYNEVTERGPKVEIAPAVEVNLDALNTAVVVSKIVEGVI